MDVTARHLIALAKELPFGRVVLIVVEVRMWMEVG